MDCSSITDRDHIEWPRMESDESSFTNFSMFSFFDLSFSGRLNFVGWEPFSGTKVL